MPHLNYLPDEMGTAAITPSSPVEAGSYVTLTYVYAAGTFGIDDTGGIKICFRTTSDIGKPQFTRPHAANYVTATASNGVALDVIYDFRLNIRPLDAHYLHPHQIWLLGLEPTLLIRGHFRSGRGIDSGAHVEIEAPAEVHRADSAAQVFFRPSNT